MSLAACLLYDHEVLRGKLALLEELLPSLRTTPYTIARLTESVVACLSRHSEEEGALAEARSPECAQRLREAHRELQARAEILLELVSPTAESDDERAILHAGYLVHDLRRHLAEEEALASRMLEHPPGAPPPVAGGPVHPWALEARMPAYREAVDRRIHAICLDRNLDPCARAHPATSCRVARFLPQLIEIVSEIHSTHLSDYEEAITQRICVLCGNQDDAGRCPVRDRAECCLYRYLPLVLDTIEEVQDRETVGNERGAA